MEQFTKRFPTKLLAVLLSVLMVLSGSIFAVNAFANAAELDDLETAMNNFTARLTNGGDIYTGLSAGNPYKGLAEAYDAYIEAQALYDAVKYGTNNGAGLTAAKDKLNNASNAITAWSPAEIPEEYDETKDIFFHDSTNFNAATGTAKDDSRSSYITAAYRNVLWDNLNASIKVPQAADSATGADVRKDLHYGTTVMMYDGKKQPSMPVLLNCHGSQGLGKTRYFFACYPMETGSGLDGQDHSDVGLKQQWIGGSGAGTQDYGFNVTS